MRTMRLKPGDLLISKMAVSIGMQNRTTDRVIQARMPGLFMGRVDRHEMMLYIDGSMLRFHPTTVYDYFRKIGHGDFTV